MNTKRFILGVVMFLVTGTIVHWALIAQPWKSPEDWLKEFYSNPMPEDLQMDPLILAGAKVVPLVLERIQDPSMPKRIVAIWFLGNGGYKEAIPVIQRMLQNESEDIYSRAYSLIALYQLDRPNGLKQSKAFYTRSDFLGKIAMEVMRETEYVTQRRSYLDALWGNHN